MIHYAHYTPAQATLFTHCTMTTTGYGNYPIPTTPQFRIFLIGYIPLSIAAVAIVVFQCMEWCRWETHHYRQRKEESRRHATLEGESYMHHVHTQSAQQQSSTHANDDSVDPPTLILKQSCKYRMMEVYQHYQTLCHILFLIALLLFGALTMAYLEDWSIWKALYFASYTLITIGYGGVTPTRTLSTWINALWLPTNVVFLVVYTNGIASLYSWCTRLNVQRHERHLRRQVERHNKEKQQSALQNHQHHHRKKLQSLTFSSTCDESTHMNNNVQEGVERAPTTPKATSSCDTMRDVIALVRTHLVQVSHYRPTIPVSLSELHYQRRWQQLLHWDATVACAAPTIRTPSFVVQVLVQERMACIIAHDVAGYEWSTTIQHDSLMVHIHSWYPIWNKWHIPPAARAAFVAVALDVLLCVGEMKLVQHGSSAILDSSPLQCHALFSPVLAAMGDSGTMEIWLARTERVAAHTMSQTVWFDHELLQEIVATKGSLELTKSKEDSSSDEDDDDDSE
jgi:hypothetical protein